MKLNRGIRAEEFESLAQSRCRGSRKVWVELLVHVCTGLDAGPGPESRARCGAQGRGQRQVPCRPIRERQHFTDDRAIALAYACKTRGLLVAVEVPPAQGTRCFRLEFQNFARRRQAFPTFYVVEARVLARHHKAWRLTTTEAR